MPAEAQSSGRLPLAGLVVIDFGQIFQGPYATFLLAQGGADVIKVEPVQGEPLRRRALPGKSATLPFAMLNQNKRAVTLNLKHPRGRELLFEMVKRADVLLLNIPDYRDIAHHFGINQIHMVLKNGAIVYREGEVSAWTEK